MAAFYNLVHKIQFESRTLMTDDRKFDIISALPVEISTSIFRMLDPTSMMAAMQVSKRWHRLYRADRPLKRALKRKVLERRRQHVEFIHNFSVRPTDSYYRRDLPVTCPYRRTTKRKRASTKHNVQCAKLLRI